jgi:hypothetical protein
MAIIEFPRHPHSNPHPSSPRLFELARRMKVNREREKKIEAERSRLQESLSRLERLSAEMESIQADLERLRAVLHGERSPR